MADEELLKEVKCYLKVDFDDDDNDIALMIQVAKRYITNGFSEYNNDNPVHRLLLMKAVSNLYENKDTITDKLTATIRLQENLGDDADE